MMQFEWFLFLSTRFLADANFVHMNGQYHFANQRPGTNATHRGTGYFEVYTPLIQSHYAEVKWDPHFIPLAADFVEKYNGKLIAIVGLESDIIRKNDAGEEIPVPTYEQYNHHYNNNVIGKGAKMVKTDFPAFQSMGCAENNEAFRGYKLVSTVGKVEASPLSNKFLPTGNGAEHRFTFKYFPPGYGALIESPTSASVMAMIIDTKNREGKGKNPTRHGVVPPSSNVGPEAMYSGLMECPCTDRYPKHESNYITQSTGVCSQALSTPEACFIAAVELGLDPIQANLTKSSANLPVGCSVTPVTGGFEVVFNGFPSTVGCGDHVHNRQSRMMGLVESLVTAKVDLQPDDPTKMASLVGTWSYVVGSYGQVLWSYDVEIAVKGDNYVAECICTSPACKCFQTQQGQVAGNILNLFPKNPGTISNDNNTITFANGVVWQRAANGTVTIELVGPADRWFGIGLGANSGGGSGESTGFTMAGSLWAVVVVDDGKVEERKLGDHQGGSVLPSTVTVLSNTVSHGQRTIKLTRAMRTGMFNFSSTTNSIPFINAVGTSQAFGHHKAKASALMYLVDVAAPTCLCFDGSAQGTIGGAAWGGQRCAKRPLSQLLDDPEWASNEKVNPTCLLKSYRGGLRCCIANSILLDTNQTVSQEIDTYQVKFRYYFEEVTDASKVSDLYWTFWWTEYNNNEHDIPACKPGEECIYKLSSNFTVGQMPGFDHTLGSKGTTFIHVEGHCHIGCLKMELWIMDDPANPKLLCRTRVTYGTSDEAHDEMGYILGNEPCIFGKSEDGFEPPIVLQADTKLMSIKYQNNTVARYGDMALWEIEGAFVKGDKLDVVI